MASGIRRNLLPVTNLRQLHPSLNPFHKPPRRHKLLPPMEANSPLPRPAAIPAPTRRWG